MVPSTLCYRGLPYDHTHDELPSPVPVEHTYRGRHFEAPLRHQASLTDKALDLIYRGHHYHPHHG